LNGQLAVLDGSIDDLLTVELVGDRIGRSTDPMLPEKAGNSVDRAREARAIGWTASSNVRDLRYGRRWRFEDFVMATAVPAPDDAAAPTERQLQDGHPAMAIQKVHELATKYGIIFG
jgi:hypothetical protein